MHCLVSEIVLSVRKEGMKDYTEFFYGLVLKVTYSLCAQVSSATVVWLYSIGHIDERRTWTCKY